MVFFIASCTSGGIFPKKIFSVGGYQKASLDANKVLTRLKVLKIYPAQLKCNQNEEYANLYICKKISDGDTVYVFDQCEEVAEFALDTNANHTVVINKNDTSVRSPAKVAIFVPVDFKMPKNAKYLFAKLSELSEY